MNIVVCLNNRDRESRLVRALSDLGRQEHVYIKETFNKSADSLLFNLESDPNREDLIVIDTKILDDDGIEIAKKIREMGYENELMFVTADRTKVFDSFSAEPLNYILEDEINGERLKETFIRAEEKMKKRKEDILSVSCAGETCNVSLENIYYFQSKGRVIEIFYKNKADNEERSFEFYSPIGKFEELIQDKGFVRIYRSIIVSLSKVLSVSRQDVTLIDGTRLPFSRYYSRINYQSIVDYMNKGLKK